MIVIENDSAARREAERKAKHYDRLAWSTQDEDKRRQYLLLASLWFEAADKESTAA